MPLFTTAYAGSGKLDDDMAAKLLDQILPQQLGLVFIPDPEPAKRKQPGLFNVVEWLTREVPEDGTIPKADLIAALLSRAEYKDDDGETQHDDLALVMVYDPENEADVSLAKQAHEAGIRVIDLCNAADDIVFETEPTEPPAEEPPFATDEGVVIGTSEDRPADAERAATGPWEDEPVQSPGKLVQAAAAAGIAAAQAVREAASGPKLTLSFDVPTDFVQALARAIVAEMGSQAMATVNEIPAAEAPAGTAQSDGASAPPVPGDPQPPNTTVWYHNIDKGTYRRARGIARSSEQRVFLTESEVSDLKDKGAIS